MMMMINHRKKVKARFICRWLTLATMDSEVLRWKVITSNNNNRCHPLIMFKRDQESRTNSRCCCNNSKCNNSRKWLWLSNKDNLLLIFMWKRVWYSRYLPQLTKTWSIKVMVEEDSNSLKSNNWFSCNSFRRKTSRHNYSSNRWWSNNSNNSSNLHSKKWWWRWVYLVMGLSLSNNSNHRYSRSKRNIWYLHKIIRWMISMMRVHL